MFTSVTLKNLIRPGETAITIADPKGWTDIFGASGSGKTSVLCAVAWGLLNADLDGKPMDATGVATGADEASVALTTVAGTTLHRTRTRTGGITRKLSRPEGEQTFRSEDELAVKLGPLVARPEVAKVVLLPLYWQRLLNANLGRPLRDLLLGLLPSTDVRAVVEALMAEAGAKMKATDPVDEPKVLALQKSANSQKERDAGALAALRTNLPQMPTDEEMTTARSVVDAAAAWALYDASAAETQRMRAAHDAGVAALAAYAERRLSLGNRPPGPTVEAMAEIDRRIAQGEALLNGERMRSQAAETRGADVLARHQRLQAGRCSECGAPIEPSAEQLEALSKDAEVQAKIVADATSKITKYTEAINRIRSDRDRLLSEGEAARTWDAAIAALGPEPKVPMAPTNAQPPESTKPTTEQQQQAQDVLHRARFASDTARRLEAAQETAKVSTAEAERVKVLVAATRQAPSKIAREQAAALGELGPVQLRFPPKENAQTAEIEVLYCGRPLHRISGGELVIADLWLRAAVRRLAKLGSLPIIVDHAQNWSGDWPSIPGPVWRLWTEEGALRVG